MGLDTLGPEMSSKKTRAVLLDEAVKAAELRVRRTSLTRSSTSSGVSSAASRSGSMLAQGLPDLPEMNQLIEDSEENLAGVLAAVDKRQSFKHTRMEAKSPTKRLGRRLSTCFRLELQGLQPLKRQASFAVRSIQKGSDDWRDALSGFVANLVFRSIAPRRFLRDDIVEFQPYTCQAAVLFVDLSGYSKITASIAHEGAHVISAAVNSYLERILDIVHKWGGDVVKFAGDAILVVWEGNSEDLELNVLCSVKCALELQKRAGEHSVEGTHHKFKIHSGLCCGDLESEVFESPTHENMQRLYHYVGGETMAEIGDLVDYAKAGETAASNRVIHFLRRNHTPVCNPIAGVEDAMLLEDIRLADNATVLFEQHVTMLVENRRVRRDRSIEEEFIHPSVLSLLSHGGENPTQIAQMRNLCVLFIAMTSQGDSTNWLLEIQGILDRNRCPILQIIYDDKGVHVVAAVNLYEAIPEASIVGLGVCRELKSKRVGATVGAAAGQTFCGVTGSSKACRWDITGPAVVRAARLMQFALNENLQFAIDQSLYDDPTAATQMLTINEAVPIKGSAHPIPVYTISGSTSFCAFRILENLSGAIHDDKVREIQKHITGRNRSVVIVTGAAMAGMRMVCQKAAGLSDFVPYLHLCELSAGFLQLATTIATWFIYVDDDEVRMIAVDVLKDMSSGCFSCAFDQCVRLVNMALRKGFRACFIVDRIEHLDKFSISLIRACQLDEKESKNGLRPVAMDAVSFDPLLGEICFFCLHRPLYTALSAQDLVQDICRSYSHISIPVVDVGQAHKEDLRSLCCDLMDVQVDDRCLDCFAESSGNCTGYFLERAEAFHRLSMELWMEDEPAMVEVGTDLILRVPPGQLLNNKQLQVTQISAETAMRFAQIFDEAPPQCQMLLKILTIATFRGFFKIPYRILWYSMNDILETGVERHEMSRLVKEMVDIHAIICETTTGSDPNGSFSEESEEYNRVLSIQNPALADVCMDVCTPVQVKAIAGVLYSRLRSIVGSTFQVPLVMASLRQLIEEDPDTLTQLWCRAYNSFLSQETHLSGTEVTKWKEIFCDEMQSAGFDPKDVLQCDVLVPVELKPRSPSVITLLRSYVAPVSLGCMGMSLSVICRNTVLEYGAFNGGCSSESRHSLLRERETATRRYLMELTVLENYMHELGVGGEFDEVQAEAEIISFLNIPSDAPSDVETKALIIAEEVIPRFVEHRRLRLHKLVAKFKDLGEFPEVIQQGSKPIQAAYRALQADKDRMDAAQDALMSLATMGWKPPRIPEHLPLSHQPSIVNLRNKTMRRLTEVEFLMYRHQQTVDDLEAFLLVCPLISASVG